MVTKTHNLRGFELVIGKDEKEYHHFYPVDVHVEITESSPGDIAYSEEVYGTISFDQPFPEDLLFEGEKQTPVSLEMVAENEQATLELDNVLCTGYSDENEIDFVANDSKLTVEEETTSDESPVNKRAIAHLSNLINQISNGEVEVEQLEQKNGLSFLPGRFQDVESQKLSVTYQDDT